MSTLLVVLSFVGALLVMILKALAVDQVRGQVQRRIRASVEAAIDSLPPELQVEWADEWRAELEAVITLPLTAARFARGLHQSAIQLVGEPTLVPASTAAKPSQPSRALERSNRFISASRQKLENWIDRGTLVARACRVVFRALDAAFRGIVESLRDICRLGVHGLRQLGEVVASLIRFVANAYQQADEMFYETCLGVASSLRAALSYLTRRQ
jgi:hypothetical protein